MVHAVVLALAYNLHRLLAKSRISSKTSASEHSVPCGTIRVPDLGATWVLRRVVSLLNSFFFYRREPEAKSRHIENLAQVLNLAWSNSSNVRLAGAPRGSLLCQARYVCLLSGFGVYVATRRYMLNGCMDVVPTEVQFKVRFGDDARVGRSDAGTSASFASVFVLTWRNTFPICSFELHGNPDSNQTQYINPDGFTSTLQEVLSSSMPLRSATR